MRPRPDHIGPNQESVWSYPRPPRCEKTSARIEIYFDNEIVASTDAAFRVLETSHPPTYYLPPDSFAEGVLLPSDRGGSWCEWKGAAQYWSIAGATRVASNCAWSYANPTPNFAMLTDHIAVYAHMMDLCLVDEEVVTPQPGNFYGGWVTSNIIGPFKGIPGSNGW